MTREKTGSPVLDYEGPGNRIDPLVPNGAAATTAYGVILQQVALMQERGYTPTPRPPEFPVHRHGGDVAIAVAQWVADDPQAAAWGRANPGLVLDMQIFAALVQALPAERRPS